MIFPLMKNMSDGSSPLKDYSLILDILADFDVYPLFGIAPGGFLGASIRFITSPVSITSELVPGAENFRRRQR